MPDIPEINKYIEIIQDNYTEDEIKLMRKAYNLIKSMLFNGDRRCICYLTTIEKAHIFNRMLSFVANIFNVEIDRDQIDCNTRRMKRSEIIQKFKNSTKLYVLLNVHVLDEGIDIPECDSVCITQPNNNIINIVQRMCRANRIYQNKTECNVYLWCSEKKMNKVLNYLFLKTDNCIKNKIFKINNNMKNNVTHVNNEHYGDEIKNDTLISYLKKHTNIDIDFITDFFIIAKEEYMDNEIIIDFSHVTKWLNVRKDSLKRILIENFEDNFDYTIEKKKKKQINSKGATIYENISITPNCLKEICMISQTAKAKEVRKYFIKMEKLVKRYFEIIKEQMYKKIGILETNLKPKTKIVGGVVYILKALNTDITLYKLGKTKGLKHRLNTYNSGNANDVEPLFILPVNDIDSVETCVKKSCKKHQYRKYKEVYEIDINVLKEVMIDCNDFVNRMAFKLSDRTEKKNFNATLGRMKKKLDKYFIYISKTD